MSTSSLRERLDAYLAHHGAAAWSAASLRHHRFILDRLVDWLHLHDHRSWSSVQPSDLDLYLLELLDRGLRRSSRDAHAWSIRGLCAWLFANGNVLRDPAARLAVLADDQLPLPPPPLSEEQVAQVLGSVGMDDVVDLRQRLHLELLYACGLRNAEAIALDCADLNLPSKELLVRCGKGGRQRIIPIFAPLIAAAENYLALRRELLCGPDLGALLLHTDGDRVPQWWMQRWMRQASADLGYRVHPHLLRHSVAVHMMQRGADIRHVQQFLGHADLDTTKIYLRLVPGALRDAYDQAMPDLLVQDDPPPTGFRRAAAG